MRNSKDGVSSLNLNNKVQFMYVSPPLLWTPSDPGMTRKYKILNFETKLF